MSFQAYLDNIKAKTGLAPDDFKALALSKGLLDPGVKTGQIVAWLKEDFGLGQGHAMAIVSTLGAVPGHGLGPDEKTADRFRGPRARWRDTFDELLERVRTFGEVAVSPTNTYLSLLKGTKKFAIVQVTSDRLDVGIKLPRAQSTGSGEPTGSGTATARLEPAGSWNSMVTHRVRIAAPGDVDDELLDWLRRAYEAA